MLQAPDVNSKKTCDSIFEMKSVLIAAPQNRARNKIVNPVRGITSGETSCHWLLGDPASELDWAWKQPRAIYLGEVRETRNMTVSSDQNYVSATKLVLSTLKHFGQCCLARPASILKGVRAS